MPQTSSRSAPRPLDSLEPRGEASAPIVGAARFDAAVRLMDSLLHDVRNPLNALAINAEVLTEKLRGEGGVVPPSQEKNLKAIREQVQRVDQVLRQFAQFLAPTAQRGECNFSEVLTRAVELLGHESRRCRVRLEAEIVPEARLSVRDVSAVGFLAMRPVLRAIERSAAGSEVRITLVTEGQQALMTVKDLGGAGEPHPELPAALEHLARELGGVAQVGEGEFRLSLPVLG